MEELIIALLKCKGIGKMAVAKYVINNEFNEEKIKMNLDNILKNDEKLNFEQYLEEAKSEIKANFDKGIKLITMLDKQFPQKLYAISNPVVYLYYKGNIKLLNTPAIGVIGSRKVSDESLEWAKDSGKYFAQQGITIVSGLALGIDASAHIGAIQINGNQIAVLPSDLDNILPNSNKQIANEIINKGGLLVTEYPVGYSIKNYCYAERDRIQSALSEVLLVIEANEKSGTMIAVNKSIKEGKQVYQLKTNNNAIIKNSVNLESDGEEIIKNIYKEYGKYTKLENKQMSLFDM